MKPHKKSYINLVYSPLEHDFPLQNLLCTNHPDSLHAWERTGKLKFLRPSVCYPLALHRAMAPVSHAHKFKF